MYLFCYCSKLEQQNEMLKLAAKEVKCNLLLNLFLIKNVEIPVFSY